MENLTLGLILLAVGIIGSQPVWAEITGGHAALNQIIKIEDLPMGAAAFAQHAPLTLSACQMNALRIGDQAGKPEITSTDCPCCRAD